MKNSKKLV